MQDENKDRFDRKNISKKWIERQIDRMVFVIV